MNNQECSSSEKSINVYKKLFQRLPRLTLSVEKSEEKRYSMNQKLSQMLKRMEAKYLRLSYVSFRIGLARKKVGRFHGIPSRIRSILMSRNFMKRLRRKTLIWAKLILNMMEKPLDGLSLTVGKRSVTFSSSSSQFSTCVTPRKTSLQSSIQKV